MIRLLFYCKPNPTLGRLAAAVAYSLSPANYDIGYFYVQDVQDDQIDWQSLFHVLDLDTTPLTPISLEQARTSIFDAVISIEKPQQAALDFPGFPVCLHWTDLDSLTDKKISQQYLLDKYFQILSHAESLFRDRLLDSIKHIRTTFDSLIGNLTDGIMVHDRSRRILLFNRTAEIITGYRAVEVIGQDCHEVFPTFFCGGDCSFCQKRSEIKNRYHYPNRFHRPSGEARDLEMSVATFSSHEQVVSGAMIIFRDVAEINVLRQKVYSKHLFQGMVGRHPSMQKIFESIEELARVNVPILIQGESGTGKEMVAEALHKLSARKNFPFVPINCGALPEGILESELFGHVRGAFTGAIRDKKGRFELANGGTLFLDEIGEISPKLQVKLLRVLQESSFMPVGGEKLVTVDVRVICATNRDLKKMIQEGTFREDLYYRLAVVPITMPSLRDHVSDIPLLIQHFVERHAEIMGQPRADFTSEVIDALMQYRWQGNVRELSNAVQYALIKCHGEQVKAEHLPVEIFNHSSQTLQRSRGRPSALEEEKVQEALASTKGNRTDAARLLGVSRMTLYRYLRSRNEYRL